jgi:TetR/AcrR family transcriptional regulator, lmrAB and yxaGH operons repressor
MSRPTTIDDATLLRRLGDVFRSVGYEAASLADLAAAAGLQKASLYHRFPQGKEQMAREVLAATASWMDTNMLASLRTDKPPHERIRRLVARLHEMYAGGTKSCLLNMLSSPHAADGPFTQEIRALFEAFIDALARVAQDAGADRRNARLRAGRVVALIQGSLVLCRSMATPQHFEEALKAIPAELLPA